MIDCQPRHYMEQLEPPIDHRQKVVIETGEFWNVYKDELNRLFVALGKEDEWSESPDDWLPGVRERWIGKEQGYSQDKEHFSADQIEAALPILEEMGLSGELVPQPGHYDETVVLGGTSAALRKRATWALNHDITSDRLVILAGQRPVDEARDGTREELLTRSKFGGRDVRGDVWAHNILHGSRALYETDMARLALLSFGDVAVTGTYLDLLDRTSLSDEDIARQPLRVLKEQHFSATFTIDGEAVEQPTVILNGLAIHRRQGDPRPTTASTIVEWLASLAPKGGVDDDPARVVVVSGNPHTLRTVEEMHRILRAVGRTDIELIPAGTVPANGTPIRTLQTALGEIVRLVDRDPTVHPAEDELERLRQEFVGDDRMLGYLAMLVAESEARHQYSPRP